MVRTSVGVVLTSLSPTPSPQLLRNTTACIVVTQPSTAGIILSTCPNSRKVQYQACFLQSSNRCWSHCRVECAATCDQRGSTVQNGAMKDEPKDYYEVLGVSVNSSPADIRKAYRLLQKIHHPDITGEEGHTMTLLLNEAYETLMDENLREVYNNAHSHIVAMRASGHKSFSGSTYSNWKGPDRPQGIFVDENVCIGCRECVFAASNTFTMVDSEGTARVKTQWGDPDPQIKVAIDLCPVNCIHYVEREDLSILEYLIRFQQKQSNGVFGGTWERPRNVFMAARTFKHQMEDKKIRATESAETPAQKQARMDADIKLNAGAFWWLWSWGMRPAAKSQQEGHGRSRKGANEWPWKGLFGPSSRSDLLMVSLTPAEAQKVVALVQDWAVTFVSSSELPLPMPFRTDLLPNGVRLTLVTADNGMLMPIGALVAVVERIEQDSAETESAASVDPNDGSDAEWFFIVRREGAKDSRPLPGEGRILKHLKNSLAGRDSYAAYSLPRNPKL